MPVLAAMVVPLPNALKISVKLSLIKSPPALRLVPVPSFALVPVLIFCLVIKKSLFSYNVIYNRLDSRIA